MQFTPIVRWMPTLFQLGVRLCSPSKATPVLWDDNV